MSFESLLIETFTPQTPTRMTDSQGGATIIYVDGTDFQGRLSRLTGNEKMSSDKETAMATHKVYCETDVDVDPEDRIVLGSRIFLVLNVLRPSNLIIDGHLEILVRENDYEL